MIVHLVIFRYDPMNNGSRKLISNLKMDDTVILFEKSTIHGIVWDQGPDASSVHHTCFFKVTINVFFVW